MTGGRGSILLHASCVALAERGLLILGPSGAGKSSLALQMLGLGARLVADDQTEIHHIGETLIARCPVPLSGLIEARGLGLLRAEPLPEAVLVLAVDLTQMETERLPPRRTLSLLGATLELVHASRENHFPAALACYLRGGRQD